MNEQIVCADKVHEIVLSETNTSQCQCGRVAFIARFAGRRGKTLRFSLPEPEIVDQSGANAPARGA